MKSYHKLLLLFAALACTATSCEPDEPPEPETVYVGMPEIERQLFDFKPGSYWVMQNTLDTTQKDTFVRISHGTYTNTYFLDGNNYKVDHIASSDTTINREIPIGISYSYFTSQSLYVDSPNNIYYLRSEFYYTPDNEIVAERLNMIQRTEISLPDSLKVKILDTTTNNSLILKKDVGLWSLSIEDSTYRLLDYHHAY